MGLARTTITKTSFLVVLVIMKVTSGRTYDMDEGEILAYFSWCCTSSLQLISFICRSRIVIVFTHSRMDQLMKVSLREISAPCCQRL